MRSARWRARSRSKSRITLAARRGRRSALPSPCRCARPACVGAAASVRGRNVLTRRFTARNPANARIAHARSHGRLLTNVLALRTNAPATCRRTALPFRAWSEYRFPMSRPALECRGLCVPDTSRGDDSDVARSTQKVPQGRRPVLPSRHVEHRFVRLQREDLHDIESRELHDEAQ